MATTVSGVLYLSQFHKSKTQRGGPISASLVRAFVVDQTNERKRRQSLSQISNRISVKTVFRNFSNRSELRDWIMFTMERLSIADFYIGRSIFVTGGTGFMGKVLVEKLLRSCPAIDRIYLLMRSSRGKNVDCRLQELIEHQVKNSLRNVATLDLASSIAWLPLILID